MSTSRTLFVTDKSSIAGKKGGRVRGVFLILMGFICVGIGASFYYGALDFGSLTSSGVSQQSGNTWAYLPIGLGVALMVAGIVVGIFDRRAA